MAEEPKKPGDKVVETGSESSKKPVVKKVKKGKTSGGGKAVRKKKTSKSEASKKSTEPEDEEDVEIVEEEDEDAEEEAVYEAKQKPKLTKAQKKLLNVRKSRKRQEPTFRRQEWFRYKKLGTAWRRPRGLQSKMRKNKKYRQNRVRIGYRTNKEVRGRHPSGFQEVLVHRPVDLEGLDPKTQAARIGHQVGTRKRIAIEDRADELGIRILNRGSV